MTARREFGNSPPLGTLLFGHRGTLALEEGKHCGGATSESPYLPHEMAGEVEDKHLINDLSD